MTPRRLLCTLLFWIASTGTCLAQVPGMVWQPPAEVEQAEQALLEMHALGVRAVRTELIQNSRLFFLADTLGLAFYQDLPFTRLPGPHLRDSLAAAQKLLARALQRAQIHRSARHFVLARRSDTSDTTACAFFAELTAMVRAQAPAGTRTAYSTPFLETDQCAGAVDEVLLEVLDDVDPWVRLRRWQAVHETPAGLAGLGTWVRAGTAPGLRIPQSAEAQARYLEQHLAALDTLAQPPSVVFVHRWRDAVADVPSTAYDLEHPRLRPYGLHTPQGERRPSYDVVAGFYSGRQKVFAFPEGRPADAAGATPWAVLVGWGVFALVGIFYALSPRFRHMVPRYFHAHNFYQEAVREGRDVLLGASLVLLVALGFSSGVVAYVIGTVLRTVPAFVMWAQWLPEGLQELLLALLTQPLLTVPLVGGLYALGLVAWGILLSVFSRRRYALSAGQALMLVVWPRWPHLLILMGAVVASTLPQATAIPLAGYLALGWLAITLYSTGRTLFDYALVTRIPAGFVALLLLLQPTVVLLVLAALIVAGHTEEVAFLKHLW